MENSYKVVYSGGEAEIIEKKSRFIASIRPVKTQEEATEFIEKIKKKCWDARHNCFAYVIGKDIQRFSDDGEPSGTAGKPMLDVLVLNGLHDVCVVVTRYFGGVLLGTGGLIRAYQKAVIQGIEACVILEPVRGELLLIKTDYNGAGKVRHIMEKLEVFQNDVKYTEDVEIEAVVTSDVKNSFIEKITEATNGKMMVTSVNEILFAVYESNLILF